MSKNSTTFFRTVSNLEHHYSLMLNFLRIYIPDVGGFFVFGAINAKIFVCSTPNANAFRGFVVGEKNYNVKAFSLAFT